MKKRNEQKPMATTLSHSLARPDAGLGHDNKSLVERQQCEMDGVVFMAVCPLDRKHRRVLNASAALASNTVGFRLRQRKSAGPFEC